MGFRKGLLPVLLCALSGLAQVPAPFSPAGDSARTAPVLPQDSAAVQADSDTARQADSDTARQADSVVAAPEQPRLVFEFYEIEDTELLADLWFQAGRAGEPEVGHYQVLKVKGDSADHAFLFREGTQLARLPDSIVPGLRGKIRNRSGMQEGRLSQSLLGNFWNPLNPLQPFQWPTGLAFDFGHAITVLKSSSPQIEQHYGASFSMRPLPWVTTEVSGAMSRYIFGIRRNLHNPNDDREEWRSWSYRQAWGSLALGIPGIKWETALDNRDIPEYYWLDPFAGSGSYIAGRERADDPIDLDEEEYAEAKLIRPWREGGRTRPRTPNFTHTLHVKIGQIRYAAVFDPDFYNSVIHDLMFEELPAPFGQWGVGFVVAEGVAHTRIRTDLFPATIGIPVPQGSYLRFFFLRAELALRDAQSFHASVTTTILLDSPILRPGGKP
jgi:hypothetical protein